MFDKMKWWVFLYAFGILFYSRNIIKGFLGHYCEIVYKLTGDKKSAINGKILDLNNAGFILIKNQKGLHCLNTLKILEIKPQEKTIGEEL